MRLIDTRTGELKEYTGTMVPRYVALSHRWTDDEVTFKDYIKGRRTGSLGHQKILAFQEVARSRGIHLIWIDTVCIDKRSSSELTEAINSMYRWYENCVECYAYLSDVRGTEETPLWRLESSVWFTRGWTLQELVAPKRVRFYSRDWAEIGFCGYSLELRRDLTYEVSEITSIPVEVLRSDVLVHHRSLAERISWLRRRTTTREEDMAYCAMGLLGINMPLLYGEGSRAWNRLQDEINRTTNDESIFTWTGTSSRWPPFAVVPIVAPSASSFSDHKTGRIADSTFRFPRLPWTMTNQGLELRLKAGTAHKIAVGPRSTRGLGRTMLIIPLNCYFETPTMGITGFLVLVLVSQPCGHFDRIITSNINIITELAHDSPDMLQHDETIHVHTTAKMQSRCYYSSVSMSGGSGGTRGASRGSLLPFIFFLDVNIDELIDNARSTKRQMWT